MTENFRLAEECAKFCSDQFKPPIELEFEKYMRPLALFAKKRYAYKEWTQPEKPHEEIEYKGIQIVRRDFCNYVKERMSNILEVIMNCNTNEEAMGLAVRQARIAIKDLLDGNVDIDKLTLSKQLNAKYTVRKNNISTEYTWSGWSTNTPQDKRKGVGPYGEKIQHPHVRLAQNIMKVDPTNHPKPPDRIPFLFEEKKGCDLQCDRVIHPNDFVVGKNKIDSMYYFEHQLKSPIEMIFELMMENPEDIYQDLVLKKVNQINRQLQITDMFGDSSEKKEDDIGELPKKSVPSKPKKSF